MNYSSPAKNENVSIAIAVEAVAKFNRMGLNYGPLHINENAFGGQEASYVPVTDLSVDGNEPYCLVVWDGGNWQNVAMMIRTWGAGDITGFQRLADMIYPAFNWASRLTSIPSVAKAINAALKKV